MNRYLCIFALFVIILGVIVNVSVESNNRNENPDLSSLLAIANADPEDDDSGYTIAKDDCTHTTSGSGIVNTAITVDLGAVSYTIPVGWNFDLNGSFTSTWSDTQRDCYSDGEAVSCSTITCNDFFATN